MLNSSEMTYLTPKGDLWEGLQTYTALPDWVLAASDPERVSYALVQNLPDLRNGNKVLNRCEIHNVRYKNGNWTGTYQLNLENKNDGATAILVSLNGTFIQPDKDRGRQMEILGELGEESWFAYLPEINLELRKQEPEKVLASLSLLTDPEGSRQLLEKSIQAGTPRLANIQIETCVPKVVRYKPGSRCTVVYQLGYRQGNSNDPAWPHLVVAKTYRNEKGVNAWKSMRAVWDSPVGTSREVTVAEPLAYLPELKVLVQGPVREQQTLKELIRAAVIQRKSGLIEDMLAVMRKTARGVIALHTSGVHFETAWTWENELSVVKEQVDNLAETIPALRLGTEPLLKHLVALTHTYPVDPLVPSHGSFRPAQVLIDQGQISFIDFDSSCQSEPALDLALFLGSVKSIGLTAFEEDEEAPFLEKAEKVERIAFLENACAVFLEEYEAVLPVSHERIALWETLDLLTTVIHSWTKVKPVRLENTLFLLERQLRQNGLLG